MRKRTRLRAVGWTVISSLSILGSLILQGCSEEAPSPYAELDAKYPDGRPGSASVEERAQDAAYTAKLVAATKELGALQAAANEAQAQADFFKGQLIDLLAKRLGKTPPRALIDAELEKNDHYQALVKTAQAAQAAANDQVVKNRQVIRERIWADVTAYDALRAEADAKAQAAGLPVRGRNSSSSQPAPSAAKPLSETAGSPAETTDK